MQRQLWPFNFQVLVASATLFLLALLGRVLCCHLGNSFFPPAHNALAKSFRKSWQVKVHHGQLSGPIFTAYVSESAQHLCPSPRTSLWSLKIFSFSAKTFHELFLALLHHSIESGSKNLDTQPEITAGGSSVAAAPFLYSCTSACGISKLFTHQNSLMFVCSH